MPRPKLVLLDGSFATLPHLVDEGRRVINNVERVANLFLTKTMYAMLLAWAVGIAGLPFPFLPRHLTLVGALTIGVPGFFLALAPNHRRAHPGFVNRVLKLAIPAGFLAAAGTFAGYALARSRQDLTLDQARTTATLTLVAIGLLVLIRLARPLTKWRTMLVLGMAALFGFTLALPFGRKFYALSLPPPQVVAAVAVIVAVVGAVMQVATWAAVRYGTLYGVLLAGEDDDPGRPRTSAATPAGRGLEDPAVPFSVELRALGPRLGHARHRGAQLVDPLLLMAVDQADAPGQRV